MQQAAFFEEKVLFSPDVPEAVNELLQAAVTATHVDKPRAEALFKQAQALNSSCVQTYFALYKFYFYQGRLLEAEREVMAGLAEAARQGDFASDYRRLAWQHQKLDMYQSDITLFYLYTLKALAFVKLRQEHTSEAHVILLLLQELDPEDRCGSSVVMSLAKALIQEAL